MDYHLKIRDLILRECESLLQEEPSSTLLDLSIDRLDHNLVDSRRQLRIWSRETQTLKKQVDKKSAEIKELKKKLTLAKKASHEELQQKVSAKINILQESQSLPKSLSIAIEKSTLLIQKKLALVEDRVQELRQKKYSLNLLEHEAFDPESLIEKKTERQWVNNKP